VTYPPSPARQRLINLLRGLRTSARLTTYQLAEALDWSQSKVTRIENGHAQPTEAEVDAWGAATGAGTAAREELASLARSAGMEVRSWRAAHRGGLAARQREMGSMEREASEILHFQPSVIPGLWQTERYARRVLELADVTSHGDIDAAVRARMIRQEILRDPGRRWDCVLTEGALRWRPAIPGLMEEQLGRLLTIAALPNVSLSIIPFDREPQAFYLHAFALYHVPGAPVVLVENYTAEIFITDRRDVDAYERIFAALRDSALTGEAAIDFARAVVLS
jgi:transcriptional regulator with XRE-family HTH domain